TGIAEQVLRALHALKQFVQDFFRDGHSCFLLVNHEPDQSYTKGRTLSGRVAQRKTDPFSQWVNNLRERRGMNRAIVAVANKNARIIWIVLNKNEEFRAPV
ncbi:MAG: hypothetical protein ACU0CU_01480, partial [Pseudooceanicola sp.]